MSNDVPLPNNETIDQVRESRIYAVDEETGDHTPVESDDGKLQVSAEITKEPSYGGLVVFETETGGQLTASEVAPGVEVLVQAGSQNSATAYVGPAGGPHAIELEPGNGFTSKVQNTNLLGVDLADGDNVIVSHEVSE